MPGIMSQLGPENQPAIAKLQEMMAGSMGGAAGAGTRTSYEESDDSDEEIPELVNDNFEDVSNST